jgi:hypothetical protein
LPSTERHVPVRRRAASNKESEARRHRAGAYVTSWSFATFATDIPAAIDQAFALAKYPNVSVKLSGSVGNSLELYPFRDMTVYLQRLFDAYGPQRCYWGTDITNSFANASYRQRVTHLSYAGF